jgi:hypothetical protein
MEKIRLGNTEDTPTANERTSNHRQNSEILEIDRDNRKRFPSKANNRKKIRGNCNAVAITNNGIICTVDRPRKIDGRDGTGTVRARAVLKTSRRGRRGGLTGRRRASHGERTLGRPESAQFEGSTLLTESGFTTKNLVSQRFTKKMRRDAMTWDEK